MCAVWAREVGWFREVAAVHGDHLVQVSLYIPHVKMYVTWWCGDAMQQEGEGCLHTWCVCVCVKCYLCIGIRKPYSSLLLVPLSPLLNVYVPVVFVAL